MRTLLLLALLLPAIIARTQTNTIDSLHHLLQTKSPDTTRANTLVMLAHKLSTSRPDSTLLLTQQALSLSQKTNFKTGERQSLTVIGGALRTTGNYNRALQYYLETLKIAEEQVIE